MPRRITDWPVDERPRERLLEKGAAALSEAELLALVLRTSGVRGETAVDQGRRLLSSLAGVVGLGRATVAELARQQGMGPASAAAVVAALELGRRAACTRVDRGGAFRTSLEVFEHFRGQLASLCKEVFYVVLLDAKHRKIREVRISEGSLTASIVHPREVFVPAVHDSAAAVILVHNHPSGDPAPSPEDLELTRRLRQAGEVVGVRVLDHIIIGGGAHFSFVDAGCW
ncbi:MAG TPA: DNA repair protein RadC [Candidatus Binatia bacterium]|nr:DNA repair protein RadC [Candidatus Binatia bacterium]